MTPVVVRVRERLERVVVAVAGDDRVFGLGHAGDVPLRVEAAVEAQVGPDALVVSVDGEEDRVGRRRERARERREAGRVADRLDVELVGGRVLGGRQVRKDVDAVRRLEPRVPVRSA